VQRSCFISIIDSLLGPPKMRPRDRSNRLLGAKREGSRRLESEMDPRRSALNIPRSRRRRPHKASADAANAMSFHPNAMQSLKARREQLQLKRSRVVNTGDTEQSAQRPREGVHSISREADDGVGDAQHYHSVANVNRNGIDIVRRLQIARLTINSMNDSRT